MHLLTLTQPCPMGLQGVIESGTYIVDDIFGGHCLSQVPAESATLNKIGGNGTIGGLSINEFKDTLSIRFAFSRQHDLSNKKILIVRPAAFGDLLFITPAIHEIKRRFPSCRITVCCMRSYGSVFQYNSDTENIIDYPLKLDAVSSYDYISFLEGMIERHPREKEMHAVDLAAEALGVSLPENGKEMRFIITEEERHAAFDRYPPTWNLQTLSNQKRRIAIQVKASTRSRTYPENLLGEVIVKLLGLGYQVFLLGFPGEIKPVKNPPPNLYNCSHDKLTFRESCALAATCDLILAPDSAAAHIGGALGIPTLSLFGPFPWKLRTAYARSVVNLTGNAPCAPCFYHKLSSREFPASGPCNVTGQCSALTDISPSRIVTTIEKMLAK